MLLALELADRAAALDEVPVVQILLDDHVGHGECHHGLRPRPQRNPLVSILAGQGEPRCQKYHPALGPVVVHSGHGCKSPVILYGGEPGLEEVGTERKHQSSLGEIVGRQPVSPKRDAGGLTDFVHILALA